MILKLDRRIAAAGSVSAILLSVTMLVAGCSSSSSPTSASTASTAASTAATSAPATSAPAAPATPASSSAASSAAAGTTVKTAHTSLGTVLVNAQGFTLYWFAPDSPTQSKCASACAQAWPPVPGPATLSAGIVLPAHFGTITRSDGTVQATYDGHPLYTFAGDKSAGQTTGNRINGFGGLWYATLPFGMPSS